MRKGKRTKSKKTKDEEVNGQERRKKGKGIPRPHAGYLPHDSSRTGRCILSNIFPLINGTQCYKAVRTHLIAVAVIL